MALSAAVFGCTDETYGYFQNLSFRELARKKTSGSGAGVYKHVNWTASRTEVTGEYVYISTAAGDAISNVGNGTAITLSDAQSPGDIYVDEAAKVKRGGPETAEEMRIQFRGTYYPDLDV